MRKLVKILYFLNKVLWLYNHRVYMKFNNKLLRKLGVKLNGDPLYIAATSSFDGTDYSLVEIGHNTVISGNVRVLTHDFAISRMLYAVGKLTDSDKEVSIKAGVKIGKNVFIGARTFILPGTIIEDNVVIGAGSIVRGKLEKNSIYIGNPAIKVRTIEEQLEKYKSKGII